MRNPPCLRLKAVISVSTSSRLAKPAAPQRRKRDDRERENQMSSNERLPQKRGAGRKAGVNPLSINTTQDQRIRATQYSEDDFLLMEDDPDASNPPRLPSSAIRINPPTTRRGSRDVSTQARRPAPYVPPR